MTPHVLFGIEWSIMQAPMAGVQGSALAIAVANASGSAVVAATRMRIARVGRRFRRRPVDVPRAAARVDVALASVVRLWEHPECAVHDGSQTEAVVVAVGDGSRDGVR